MEITEIYTGPLFVKTWAFPLDKKTVLLVDPGGTDEELMEYLKNKNAERLEIMLTHGHFDHVGGVPELMLKYPGSSLWIHHADAGYLGKNGKEKHIACFSQIRAERYIKALKYDFIYPRAYRRLGLLLERGSKSPLLGRYPFLPLPWKNRPFGRGRSKDEGFTKISFKFA